MTVSDAVRVLPSSRPASRSWLIPTERPQVPAPPPEAPLPALGAGRVVRVGSSWGARAPDGVPDAVRWTGWFAVALGEALLGRRPATQLAGWVSPEVLAGLNRRQRLRPAGDLAPRTLLLSGRVQHPGARSAEASAVLRSGPRLLVLAFRLEAEGAQWRCTALDAGLTPTPRRSGAG